MKTLRFTAALAFLLAIAHPARAAMGEIKTPNLLVTDAPQTEAALRKALERPDVKFLKGHWLNSWSTLHFGGDTIALNLFLADLARCPGLSVSIRFRKSPTEGSWMVGQNRNEPSVTVYVNTASEQIDLERIALPEWRGPVAP